MKVHNFTGENAIKDAMDYAMRFAEKNNTPFNQELFDSLVFRGYITIDGKNPYEESIENLDSGNVVDVEGGEVEGDETEVEMTPEEKREMINNSYKERFDKIVDDALHVYDEDASYKSNIDSIAKAYQKLIDEKYDLTSKYSAGKVKNKEGYKEKLNIINSALSRIEESQEVKDIFEGIRNGDVSGWTSFTNPSDASVFKDIAERVGSRQMNSKDSVRNRGESVANNSFMRTVGAGETHTPFQGFQAALKSYDEYNDNYGEGGLLVDGGGSEEEVKPSEETKTQDNSPKTLSFRYGEDIYNMQGDKNAYLNKRDLSTAVAMSKHNKVSDEDIWEYLNQNEKFVNAKEEDKQRTFERVKSKIEKVSNKNKKKEDEVKKEDEAKKEDEVKTEETPASTETETPVDIETETSIETEEESIPMNEDTLNLSRDVGLKKGDKDADYRQYDYDKLRKYIDKKAKDDYNTWLHEPNAKRTITLSDAEKEKMKNDIRQSVIKEVSQLYKLPINEDTLNGVGDNEKQIDEETLQKMINKKAKEDYNTWLHEPNAKRTITLTNDEKNKMKDDIHTSVTKELSQLYKVPMNEDTLNGSGDVETVVTEKKPVTKTETKKTNTNKTGKKISMNDIMSWTKNILRGGK